VICKKSISKFPTFTDVLLQELESSKVYEEFRSLFHNKTPRIIQKHRQFFKTGGRGFGEDAFHAMWLSILNEFRPQNLLEIGVYRGQVISLWGLISKSLAHESTIYGLSPFEAIGDSVGSYPESVNYQQDVLANLRKFKVKNVQLIKSLSEAPLGMDFILSREWDLIYVDGSHDYDTVKHDCLTSVEALRSGGVLVMDDAALYRHYEPMPGAFAGHPGPSKVAEELISGSFGSGKVDYLGHCGHNLVFLKI
jgi:hypothetical protein